MEATTFSTDAIFSDLRKRIDEEISKHLHGLVEKHKFLTVPDLCYRTIENFVLNGGKRIRPILCLLSYLATSSTSELAPSVLRCAMAVEFIHQSSLIHDDVMDEDETRRGKPTVWKSLTSAPANESSHRLFTTSEAQCGASLAVVAGNLLYCEAFSLAAVDKNCAKIAAECYHVVNVGQIEDLSPSPLSSSTLLKNAAEYVRMTRRKTACLLMAPATLGCECSGASDAQRKVIAAAIEIAAIAFQIYDDVMDLSPCHQKGHQLFSDIAQSKVTPLALVAAERRGVKRDEFLKMYTGAKTPEIIKEIADVITTTAVDDVIAVSNGLVEKSIAILEGREWKEMKFDEKDTVLNYLAQLKPSIRFEEIGNEELTEIPKASFNTTYLDALKHLLKSFVDRKI